MKKVKHSETWVPARLLKALLFGLNSLMTLEYAFSHL